MTIDTGQPSQYILLKLASTCNLACTYCYWFRDPSVRKRPSVLTKEAEVAFVEKLEAHIKRNSLVSFFILFHGGEPLLFGKKRFRVLCDALRDLEMRTGCKLRLSITTNGTLLDAEWVALFQLHRVAPTLSIDSTEGSHDKRRIDFRGRGSFERTFKALSLLRENGVEPGVLAVFDPEANPKEAIEHLTGTLGLKSFDILIPDATHDDPIVAPIGPSYVEMFDIWRARDGAAGFDFRLFRNIVSALMGFGSRSESVGLAPVTTSTMLTDGSLEPLDILRIAGEGHTATAFNIFEHQLDDVRQSPLWREVHEASTRLPTVCEQCEFKVACGGGLIANRWSSGRRYDNPSVYCEDLKMIFKHAESTLADSVFIETLTG